MLSRAGHIEITLSCRDYLLIKYIAQVNSIICCSYFSEFLWSYLMPSKSDRLARWRWIQSFLCNSSWLCLIWCLSIKVIIFLYSWLLWCNYEFAALRLSFTLISLNLSWSLRRPNFPIVQWATILLLLLRLYLWENLLLWLNLWNLFINILWGPKLSLVWGVIVWWKEKLFAFHRNFTGDWVVYL